MSETPERYARLMRKALIHFDTPSGRTADLEEALSLIKAGGDVDTIETNQGRTALMIACNSNVSKENDGGQLFHSAFPRSTDANIEMVKALVGIGANVNLKDYANRTAFFYAVSGNRLDICQTLIDSGADINTLCGMDRVPALTMAILSNNDRMVELLIAQPLLDINAIDHKGQSPLLWASSRNRRPCSVVSQLLNKGANPSLVSNEGMTALDWAKKRKDEALISLIEIHIVRHEESSSKERESTVSSLFGLAR